MDFIEGLPVSNGKDKILIVVDKLTKYAHFIRMRKSNSVKQITKIFARMSPNYMGFPKSLLVIETPDSKVISGRKFSSI